PFAPIVTPAPPLVELPSPRDPTPTVLGVGTVNLHDPEPHTTLDVVTAGLDHAEPEHLPPAPAPAVSVLPECTVLAQPTEDPALAFSLSSRAEGLTPPVPHAAEARVLPP